MQNIVKMVVRPAKNRRLMTINEDLRQSKKWQPKLAKTDRNCEIERDLKEMTGKIIVNLNLTSMDIKLEILIV